MCIRDRSEGLMLALTQKGLAREKAYKMIQKNAMVVWQTQEEFIDVLLKDNELKKYLSANEIKKILNLDHALRRTDQIFKKVFKKFKKILKPIWKPLVLIGKRVDKNLVRPPQDISAKDLENVLKLTDSTERSTDEAEILERIVKFGDKDAKQVMTPRTDVTSFTLEESWTVLRASVVASGYSRIPIHQGSIDEVVGVLHVKDLIPLLNLDAAPWNNLLREPFFIPENMKIDDLLLEFQTRKAVSYTHLTLPTIYSV